MNICCDCSGIAPPVGFLALGPDSGCATGEPLVGGGGSVFLPQATRQKSRQVRVRMMRTSYSYGFLRCQARTTLVPLTVNVSSKSDFSSSQSRSPVARRIAD